METLATTMQGRVRGRTTDGVTTFLGIPYAAPPVGELRFMAPQPHAAWDDVRDASVPGPTPPQVVRPFPNLNMTPFIGDGWHPGDDYLTLNVWTPDVAARGLPVMVFIHGGAWVVGSKDCSIHDGTAFARSGVVCIAINYRMGVEGFVAIPGGASNIGLRDMIAALQWIKANAAAFGGDGGNVTVFGESAGAMSVANLIASPLAQGLFGKAIIQSGHGSMVKPVKVAARVVTAMAKLLKITPDLKGFRSTTPQACVDAIEQIAKPTAKIDLRDGNGLEPSFGLSRFLPLYGDEVLPVHPLKALAAGQGRDIQLLIGTNAEEMNIYFVPTGVRKKLPGWLAWMALGKVIRRAGAILKAYKKPGHKAGDTFTEALHDLVFRYPARQFAAAHQGRTHLYEFTWTSPLFDGQMGACHALELPFVFNTLAAATGSDGMAGMAPPQDLADRVHRIWVDFARDGALPWPPYDPVAPRTYDFQTGLEQPDPPMAAARFLPVQG